MRAEKNYIILSIFLMFLLSCNELKEQEKKIVKLHKQTEIVQNDTTAIIKSVLDSASLKENKQSFTVFTDKAFGDTVVVTSKYDLGMCFPMQIRNKVFVFKSKDETCTSFLTEPYKFQRCIDISHFRKDTTGDFYVFIENNEIIRVVISEGAKQITHCEYSPLGGWEIVIIFKEGVYDHPQVKQYGSH